MKIKAKSQCNGQMQFSFADCSGVASEYIYAPVQKQTMLTVQELEEMMHKAIDMAKAIGIKLWYIDDHIEVCNYKSAWAKCHRTRMRCEPKTYTCHITVSKNLLYADKDLVMNTIAHEVIHAEEGSSGHTGLWKRSAAKMNAAYGLHISRTSSDDSLGISKEGKEEMLNSSKYLLKCKKCGKIISKNRMCGIVKNPNGYTHSNCGGGTFERIK